MDDFLNDKQNEFVLSTIEDSKLLGIPGGGKTTTIIYKILNHFKKKDFKNKSDFLISTFSRKACNDFIEKGNSIKSSLFSKDNVRTFHSLSGTIIQKLLGKQCNSLQVTIISAINAIKLKSNEELKMVKCLKNIKIIIVDEAQDLSDIQYELILLLRDKLKIKLVLVGDPNQNIYQFQNGSDKYLLEYQAKEYFLIENNRSTPQITEFINYFRPWNNTMPKMISSKKHDVSYSKPIIFSGSHDEICQRIYNEIKNTNIPYEKIAIIGPVKKSDKKNDDSYNKFGLQKITNMLSKHKIPFLKHYNETTDEIDTNIEIPAEDGKINIYTIHGSKGLEFDKVILVNFHFRTFGKVPTQEEYNVFRYLWYVALSRAKYELLVCCDNDKLCWNELRYCPEKLYNIAGDEPILKSPTFGSESDISNKMSELISNKKIFTEDKLLDFYEKVNFSEEIEKMYRIRCGGKERYAQLVSNFMKCIFEYYYCIFHLSEVQFITKIKNFVLNTIQISNKFKIYFNSFMDKCGLDIMQTTNMSYLESHKNKFNKNEKKLFEHICNKVDKKNNNFSLCFKNDDIFMNSRKITNICNKITNCHKINWNIFKLCLFEYQYENEAKYLWEDKEQFREYPRIYSEIISKIRSYVTELKNDYVFNKKCVHPNLEIYETADMISGKGTIIQLQFSDVIDLTDKLNGFFCYHAYYNKWNHKKKIEIWNLKTGMKHTLLFKPELTNLIMSMYMSEIIKKRLKNIILLYDLETTGLDVRSCEIIERYIHEITHDEEFSNGVVRSNCSVPKIVTDLTGITNSEVKKGEDISILRKEMKRLFDICDSPTFIAHNGNVFDHQVMRNSGMIFGFCKYLDSRQIIRQLSQNKVGGESLTDTYKIVLEHDYKGKAHRARADVIMVLDIFNKIGITETMLLQMS